MLAMQSLGHAHMFAHDPWRLAEVVSIPSKFITKAYLSLRYVSIMAATIIGCPDRRAIRKPQQQQTFLCENGNWQQRLDNFG